MTSYIARSGGQKKKNLLRQMELSLRGDIRRQVTREKLTRSAEKVRSAHLGVAKALSHEVEPARAEDEETSKVALAKLRQITEYWETISNDEIIDIYSRELHDDTYVDRKKWWDFRPR